LFLNIFSADRSQSAAPFVTHLIINFEIGHLHSDTCLRLFLLLLKEAMHSSWDNSSACILLVATSHGESLARSNVTISHDGAMVAPEHIIYDFFGTQIENSLLISCPNNAVQREHDLIGVGLRRPSLLLCFFCTSIRTIALASSKCNAEEGLEDGRILRCTFILHSHSPYGISLMKQLL
jgi:hypothetical protein